MSVNMEDVNDFGRKSCTQCSVLQLLPYKKDKHDWKSRSIYYVDQIGSQTEIAHGISPWDNCTGLVGVKS